MPSRGRRTRLRVLDDLDVEVGGVRLDDVAVGRGDRDHALPALPLEQAVGEGAQVVHALRVHARGGQRHPGAPAPRLQAAPLQLGVAELLLQLVDPLLRLAQAPLQVGPGRLRRRLPPLQLVLRRLARHQVDPAQPGADAPLGTDQHHPHLGRALEVGAAAQLAGPVAEADHPDDVAVLLAEERHRARGTGLGDRPVADVERQRGAHLLVHQPADPLQLVRRQGAVEGEVEGRVVRPDVRAALEGGVAQHGVERLVEEVGGRVVAGGRQAPLLVHRRLDRLPGGDPADLDRPQMGDHALGRLLGVLDPDPAHAGGEVAGVAHLAARFGVEGRPVEEDLDLVALFGGRDRLPTSVDGGDPGRGRQLVVAGELRLGQGEEVGPALATHRPGARPLAGHGRLEALQVDLDLPLGGELAGQLDREAIGVVELEHLVAGKQVGVAGQQPLELLQALLQGALEALRLLGDLEPDHHPVGHQLRVRLAHHSDHGVDPLRQRRAEAEPAGVDHGSADQPPEHVAAALGARHHAVRDQEGHPPEVVGQQPLRPLVGARPALADEVEDGQPEVGLEGRGDALEDLGHPVEAHAGVDARPGERRQRTVALAVVLHEDQVPELEEAGAVVGVAVGLAAADLRPAVPPELGVRPAGPRLPRRPPVLLVPVHPGGVDVGGALPDLVRLIVGRMDGHPEAVLGELEDLRHELPGEGDGALLEVVAGRCEVAQHLEEGQVAVVADLLDVPRPEGLLAGGEAGRGRLAHALEVGLERLHAGRDQQGGGVPLRYQRRAGQDEVIPAGEEL